MRRLAPWQADASEGRTRSCDTADSVARAVQSPPDVTVSIVNTSNRDQLLDCLSSLAAESDRRATVEVVVLDNDSDDDSVAAIRSRFPDVRVIEQRARHGFGANHNAVIRATTGRHVFVLNDDTIVHPGAIDTLVDYLDARAAVGAVGPRVMFPDGSRHPSAWRFPSPQAALVGLATLSRRGVVQSDTDEPRAVDWAHGCALMVRRETLDVTGPFDEEFFIYSEETDLCRRIWSKGQEVHYVPRALVTHIGNQTSTRVPERRINEAWRSRHRYWRKHHSPVGARVAAVATGAQYAARAAIAAAVLRLPEEHRPIRVEPVQPAEFLLNARNAVALRGPGLAELARERNAERA